LGAEFSEFERGVGGVGGGFEDESVADEEAGGEFYEGD
jgi:hypothetical protein